MNPLLKLNAFGQSVWLDYIRRDFVLNGELAKLIREDGLAGLTSNPAIFEKAIGGGNEYAPAIRALKERGLSAMALYETLAIEDIQAAADQFRPVFDAGKGHDGYVSLEVSPYLARDTAATVAEAKRLWREVSRPNLMIKVPATLEGLPAIELLISQDMNVNVTLLFSQAMYEKVAERYIAGLERRAAEGGDLGRISSVASFFISRIDAAVDPLLPEALRGKTAIANAMLAYDSYKRLFSGPRWENLAEKGARPQRLLWASTSTKNPAYRDVLYVEELIGSNTVNTLPPATLESFRDHGVPRASLEEDIGAARATLEAVAKHASLDEVTDKLLDDGVKLFADAFDKLLKAVETASKSA
ncbi:MAG: transaldolase, partial [Betaproteobacteria bacterium]